MAKLGKRTRAAREAFAARGIETDPALPTIALRAELDALPGHDLTNPAYRSIYADRMHACGHDAHMTMVLGAAAHRLPGSAHRLVAAAAKRTPSSSGLQ